MFLDGRVVGRGETTTITPIVSGHPAELSKAYISSCWRKNAIHEAAINAWPGIVGWAAGYRRGVRAMIYGFDWDGTLVTSWTAEPLVAARSALRARPPSARTFIATNQAGPVYRAVLGDPKYPTTAAVAERIRSGLGLWALDWRPDLVLVCVHPGRTERAWLEAARRVGYDLSRMIVDLPTIYGGGTLVSIDPSWRKPAPGMLQYATIQFGVTPAEMVYVGDMASDREAAQQAGCRYVDAADWRALSALE